ncbi:type VI secretion system Vgr family protein [Erwinia sp. V71]|uniref:type VI secretion system Vgr family protein n=1 Tax=Erwinia sp. V71 TaxID=3369424 RepID=UPI003F6357A6
MERVVVVHTPLGDDRLLFKTLQGTEQLSALYEFTLELLSPDHQLALSPLLGKTLTVEVIPASAPSRYFSGVIAQISYLGREEHGERYARYAACIRPALWYLTQNRDCRIWQDKTVPEILSDVLRRHGIAFRNQLSWRYRPWQYCVQYQESDFAFISRLMEHEGIYYWFTHQVDGQTMMLADAPLAHGALAGHEPPLLQRSATTRWQLSHHITPALCSLDDYDFRQPRAHLLAVRQNPASCATVNSEIFDWPGHFSDRQQGEFYARVRQQECAARHQQLSGSSDSCAIACGCLFTLDDDFRQPVDACWLAVSTEWSLSANPYASGSGTGGELAVRFSAIPAASNWRPPRLTPWPKTHGPQSAEVVGPPGETLWTDQYGRVRLQFRWDRYGASDDLSSCWVRVASSWAGWRYGTIQVPRVGEEVLVDFINGDPDRPVIIGRLYNQQNMPPWPLPEAACRSGLMSHSCADASDHASYWFVDDAPGEESFSLHAGRDMRITAENTLHISSPGKITLQSDTAVEIDAPSSSLNTRNTAYTTTGFNVGITGLDIKMNAATVTSTLSSNDIKGVASSVTGVAISKTGVEMKTSGVKYSFSELHNDISAVRTLMSDVFLYM